jgi:serine protease Do
VFAVGNALGQGIVIRDGVYTSDTPEEMNGEWKWLRFSAAASPGNSGGPLVDQSGKVIGVVLRKSEAENLNYALPIARIASAADGVGKVETRSAVKLPIMDASETMSVKEQFTLPLPLQQFYHTLFSITQKQFADAYAQLTAHNKAHLFPNGAGSAELLHRTFASPFPRYLRENQDGVWGLSAANPRLFQLDQNGFVRIAGGTIRLRAPDNIELGRLYSDSKLLMDLVLKGMALRRQVGEEQVRVTSLGKAAEGGTYTDHYGRVWQLRSWNLPYADLVLSALCMPTPEGYALIIAPVQSGFADLAVQQEKFLADYVYVTMIGTLGGWHEYLTHQDLQPLIFRSLRIDIDPARHVLFQSKRVDFEVKPDLVKLSNDSLLEIQFSFFRDGDAVVWDVSKVGVAESAQKRDIASVLRISAPDSSLPQAFQATWSKIGAGDTPYDSRVSSSDGVSVIRTVAKIDRRKQSEAHVRYVLTVDWEGQQPQDAMSRKLKTLERSVKPLE